MMMMLMLMDDGGGRGCDPAAGTPGQRIRAPVARMRVQSDDVEENHGSGRKAVRAVVDGQLLTVRSSVLWDQQHGREEAQCFMLQRFLPQ